MDVSTPPSLDSACPQTKTDLGKHDHRFIEWSVDNKEYEHEASVFTFSTQIYSKQQPILIKLLENKWINNNMLRYNKVETHLAMANEVFS